MISTTRFASQYVKARLVSATYAKRLAWTAAALEHHAGRTDVSDVFTEATVNAWLASFNDRSPFTVRSYRSDALSLWNGAADCDLVPYPIMRRIRLPLVPELLIDCYSLDEARELLAATRSLVGAYRWGVTRSNYWSAAIRLAWDSGLRRGDVVTFRRDAVRADGSFAVCQAKTRKVVRGKLHRSTLTALDAIGGNYPLRWTTDIIYFSRHFRRLVVASGVNRGTFKWLRRSSGSHVETEQPGAGYKHLGQSGPQVFSRHYDARLGGHKLPQPPEL